MNLKRNIAAIMVFIKGLLKSISLGLIGYGVALLLFFGHGYYDNKSNNYYGHSYLSSDCRVKFSIYGEEVVNSSEKCDLERSDAEKYIKLHDEAKDVADSLGVSTMVAFYLSSLYIIIVSLIYIVFSFDFVGGIKRGSRAAKEIKHELALKNASSQLDSCTKLYEQGLISEAQYNDRVEKIRAKLKGLPG